MPAKLATTIAKIGTIIPNDTNAAVVQEYSDYLKSRAVSESHHNNCLKAAIAFSRHLGPKQTFYDVEKREQVLGFLDTKIKSPEIDPDKRWITTWNDQLRRLKMFYRWLFNGRGKTESDNDDERLWSEEWKTPEFLKIRERRAVRLSPYTETEIWERDEVLFVIKYEPSKRNKAVLALLWDLDARNHEVTRLKIKHLRLKERYGEGEIPTNTKTGGGPILLTCSFPYVRDLLNEHPFRNSPEASVICNSKTGAPVRSEVPWNIMKALRKRIIRLLETNEIADPQEREKLEFLLKTKKWNPYCLRHSAITADSDFLPEYALKKKVRWSMNSKQGSRYIKRRMGNELKRQILERNGIVSGDMALAIKPAVLNCPRCALVNAVENKFCSKCSYPLTPDGFDEIKENERSLRENMAKEHEQNMKTMKEEMRNEVRLQFSKLLGSLKPEVLQQGLA